MKERARCAVFLRDAIRPHLGVLERERAFPKFGIAFPGRPYMTLKRQRGFSLLELMITIAIGLTLAGITFIAMDLFIENCRELT